MLFNNATRDFVAGLVSRNNCMSYKQRSGLTLPWRLVPDINISSAWGHITYLPQAIHHLPLVRSFTTDSLSCETDTDQGTRGSGWIAESK